MFLSSASTLKNLATFDAESQLFFSSWILGIAGRVQRQQESPEQARVISSKVCSMLRTSRGHLSWVRVRWSHPYQRMVG